MEGGAYRIDERAQVEEDGVEGDHAHGLQGVAVDDVAADHGVADLDAGGDCGFFCQSVLLGRGAKGRGVLTEEKGDLSHYPMVALVDADAPDDQANWKSVRS